jgi:hypothetical protein
MRQRSVSCRPRSESSNAPTRHPAGGKLILRAGARPATALVVAFIEGHKARFGVEPICRVLSEHGVPIAPSTYYAAGHRPVSALRRRDVELTELIRTVHAGNYGVYGYRKVWHELTRRGVAVGRQTVARLMRTAGPAGVSRSKSTRTTRPAATAQRPAELLERAFNAAAPNSRWVADISYVWTPGLGSSTSRSSPTCSPGASSAGGRRARYAPTWPSTPSSTACGSVPAKAGRPPKWCITATAAASLG